MSVRVRHEDGREYEFQASPDGHVYIDNKETVISNPDNLPIGNDVGLKGLTRIGLGLLVLVLMAIFLISLIA